jgi:hypothetical protein
MLCDEFCLLRFYKCWISSLTPLSWSLSRSIMAVSFAIHVLIKGITSRFLVLGGRSGSTSSNVKLLLLFANKNSRISFNFSLASGAGNPIISRLIRCSAIRLQSSFFSLTDSFLFATYAARSTSPTSNAI